MADDNKINRFNDDGSRPNDFVDGIAITVIMLVVVAGIAFFLYTM